MMKEKSLLTARVMCFGTTFDVFPYYRAPLFAIYVKGNKKNKRGIFI